MTTRRVLGCALAALLCGSGMAVGETVSGFTVEVLVDGQPLTVHHWHGVRYIEAVKDREYSIRLHNPLGVRVAVALSVDGLNSIDARRTSAATARKWVLGPHETVTISGWQTSQQHARRFYFTSEEESYASRLGRADNLGIISAAFFRERLPVVVPITPRRETDRDEPRDERRERGASPESKTGSAERAQPRAAAPSAAAQAPPAEDYAATGIGRRTDHPVIQVHLDLEPSPVAAIDLRYEYRSQLVRLGVLPPRADRLTRREDARGFEPGFCPEPPRRTPR